MKIKLMNKRVVPFASSYKSLNTLILSSEQILAREFIVDSFFAVHSRYILLDSCLVITLNSLFVFYMKVAVHNARSVSPRILMHDNISPINRVKGIT